MAEIVRSPTSPFPVELLAFEEDRWLILSARSRMLPERRPTDTLVEEMALADVPDQGTVIVRGNQALAVVHDLEQSPSFGIDVIEQLLAAIDAHCQTSDIRAIGLQPLGAVHGDLSVDEFVAVLARSPLSRLERIWVMDQTME